MIRTLLLDLGNVICPFSHERMCEQVGDVCGQTAEQIRQFLFQDQWLTALETGQITSDEFQSRLEKYANRTIVSSELWHAFCDIFSLDVSFVNSISILKSQGYRTILLSNTSRPHAEFVFREYGLADLFDDLVLSFEVGATKPQAAIYEHALNVIGCAPHQCFYTDDIQHYIIEARKHGLQAELFEGTDKFLAQLKERGVLI